MLLAMWVLSASAVRGQYFTLPGWHAYSLNSVNQVFDLSPDGKIGVSLRNDPVSTHPAILTTFDPILGTSMDSKTFGFGPLGVSVAQVGSALRAIVLTSEGGPRRIYLFDISSTGELTQLGSTPLTTSISDGGSNLVLSGSAQAGFVIVYTDVSADLVSFSLVDGAILNRLALPGVAGTVVMNEASNSRRLAFRIGNTFTIVNALNPGQLSVSGTVQLISNGEFSGNGNDGIVFSNDGRYVFVGNQFYQFAAIDLTTMQIVGTIPNNNYRFGRVRIFENNQERRLAVLSSPSGTGGVMAILLINANDPTNLFVINQYNPSNESFFYKSDFAFSHDGTRLFAAPKEKLIAFDLPTFNKAWEQPVPASGLQVHQLKVYGSNDEVLGAWDASSGLGFTSIFGAFPASPPEVSINQLSTTNEADGTVNFAVALSSSAAPHKVVVTYATSDGTATSGSDYTNSSGTLTFEPGVTSKVIAVPIINDLSDEFDESFTLNIQSASPGIITRSQSTGTILDDDAPPSASINDVSIAEGNSGTRTLIFSVSLSVASGKPITLAYATADGTATASDDYIPATGVITFSSGQITNPITVLVKGDSLVESNETLFVNLSSPVNTTIADGTGLGTIVDNDFPILATEQNSQRGIALDSVTLIRDPFPLINPNYVGLDHRTRVALFATNLVLTPGLVVTAQGVDPQQIAYQLPVEFVGSLPTFVGLTQIVVRLPDGVPPGNLRVTIVALGRTSNGVLIGIAP